MTAKYHIMNGCLLMSMICVVSASADVLILTEDRAIAAAAVRIRSNGVIQTDTVSDLKLEDVLLMRFDTLPCDAGPRAWLCFRQGQRISGRSLSVGPDRISLTASNGSTITAGLDELSAVFFRVDQPTNTQPPETGVRIVSANGDVMNAPAVELTEAGAIVDISPDVDPILLVRDRVAGVLWPSNPASAEGLFVELRTGERLTGQIISLDETVLVLKTDGAAKKIHVRDISEIQREPRRKRLIDERVPAWPSSQDRPQYRIGRNALGGPLAIGRRLYRQGIGCRGPVALDVDVPAGARWFVADFGVDNRAASFARVTFTVLVNGEPKSQLDNISPGEPARRLAVAVRNVNTITLKVEPVGESPVGCLGDIVDAMFVE